MREAAMKLGSLCSGAGGLDMAVEAVFDAETVWHCEKDEAASKVLAARWPGVPNFGDLTITDWSQVEPVEILCAGWPCQPWSAAGKKLGADDERAIWPEIERAIRILRPRIIVLENVPRVAAVGELERVANSMARCGYDIRWVCLRASDIGAPHQRKRIFILAADATQRRIALPPSPGAAIRPSLDNITDLLPTPKASDGQRQNCSSEKRRHTPSLVSIDYYYPDARWGKYEPAIRRWENLTRTAPSPTEPNKNGNPRLAAAFSEWMQGWPAGWVTDVPGISRNDKLRIIGNGVVPQQGIAALRWLLAVESLGVS